MKTIYNINKWFFMITLGLYLTIYFGLIAQIFLGGFQILTIIFILISYQYLFTSRIKKWIITYFVGLVVYGGLVYYLEYIFKGSAVKFEIFMMCVFPMLLATVHLYLTYLLKNQDHEL